MLGRAAAAAALTGLAERHTNTQRRRRKQRKKLKKKKKVSKDGKKELVRRVTRTWLNPHKGRIHPRIGDESLPFSGGKNSEKSLPERVHKTAVKSYLSVSYTHLTLPTIYSV